MPVPRLHALVLVVFGVSTACADNAPRDDDPACRNVFHHDRDGDGFGDPDDWGYACARPDGTVVDASDCDDADPAVHPGADEQIGDERDSDCDGGELCYENRDDDASRTEAVVESDDDDCRDPGEGAASFPIDCDDGNARLDTGAAEDCSNGEDDDCDSLADFADPDCGGPAPSIDSDGVVRVRGERFFPLGVVLPWYGRWGIDWDLTFRELVEADANFFMYVDDGVSDLCAELFPRAREAGIRFGIGSAQTWFWNVFDEGGDCRYPIDPPVYSDAFVERILDCGRYDPDFLVWFNRDEPVWNYHPTCVPNRHMISESDVRETYSDLVAEDPRRLVWMNFATAHRERSQAAYVRDVSRYTESGADIGGFDIYPYPYHRPGSFGYGRCVEPAPEDRADWCWENVVDNPEPSVVGDVARLYASEIANGKPSWAILEGYQGVPQADQLFMAYQAIVNGVRGLVFAGHQWEPDGPETWARSTKATLRELASIEDVLAAPDVDLLPTDGPGIELLVKDPGDRLVILAVNRTRDPIAATFHLEGVALDGDSVEVLFEDRALSIGAARFSDEIGPYARRVYEVPGRPEP